MENSHLKTVRLFAATGFMVSMVSLSTLTVVAQQPEPSAQPNATQGTTGAQVPDTAQAKVSGSATASARMQPVKGELVRRLDSKTAKTGDSVVVKTRGPVKAADGTVIPKGSRLMGHVTAVRSHGKDAENSKLAIQIDRAELKGGQSVAIQSVIESVTPVPSETEMAGPAPFDAGTAAGMPANGGAVASGRPGSATQTGAMPSAVPAVPTPAPMEGNTADRGDGGAAAEGKAASGSDENVVRWTAIPGVLLAQGNGDPAVSGTLFGSKRNVQLDAGTELVLAVSAATAQ